MPQKSAVKASGIAALAGAVALIAGGQSAAVAATQSSTAAWPGGTTVKVADEQDAFGENLSGLSFQGSGVLWAVNNGPGTLYRLVPDGANWVPDQNNGWQDGKDLHYPDGDGDPDAEGVVATADGVFVSTERDNDNNDDSKPEILRYNGSSSSGSLDATGEWDLTSDLPDSDANEGLEGISWVPDSYLTAHGLVDEHTGDTYDPADYPGHGSGLYFAALESNGKVYGYALDLSSGSYTRVVTIDSGLSALMELEFDPSSGHLWALCDDNCDGESVTLDIGGDGAFAVSGDYARPSGMPNYNNEGFAIAPQGTCGSTKTVVWSDDKADDGHALRSGTLSCGA